MFTVSATTTGVTTRHLPTVYTCTRCLLHIVSTMLADFSFSVPAADSDTLIMNRYRYCSVPAALTCVYDSWCAVESGILSVTYRLLWIIFTPGNVPVFPVVNLVIENFSEDTP